MIILLAATDANIFSAEQLSANEIHAKLVKTIAASQGFSAEFSVASGNGTISGTVKAKRGNKFVMNFWERKVTCNGKTVWNYTPAKKSVVIGKYDASQQQTNLESLFFTLLERYAPIGFSRKIQSNGGKFDVLKLQPANSNAPIDDISAIEIYLKPNTETIQKIGVKLGGQTIYYTLSHLKFLSSISDSEFEFSTPKGVETVDMR